MNNENSEQEDSKNQTTPNSLKAVAIEIFKKSQRLPPLSLLTKKNKSKPKRRSERTLSPPHAFEFADFYHL